MIRVTNIANRYGGVQVLKDVSLSLQEGDFLVLFGADDAGKTSLLHILMGFNTSFSGKVRLLGGRPNHLDPARRRQIRFVPEGLLAESRVTGGDYLDNARAAAERYDEELQWNLCEEFAVPLQKELAGMEEQENKLVQIIGAVCARPKILILDEPACFLERKVYAALLAHLKQWNGEGMTILLAAEQYEDAQGYCNRYAYLKNGRLAAVGQVNPKEKRGKVVTVTGGNKETLRRYMTKYIGQYRDKTVYYYKGNMKRLAAMLYSAACVDWFAEEMTLREELDGDFGRWI